MINKRSSKKYNKKKNLKISQPIKDNLKEVV